MTTGRILAVPLAAALTAAVLAACSGGTTSSTGGSPPASTSTASTSTAPASTGAATIPGSGASSSSTKPTPVATESNPPGDIPDNQAFVAFSPSGASFSVKVPEGWARTKTGGSTVFTDKLNRIQISSAPATGAPTEASVRSTDVPALTKSAPKFSMGKITTVSRQGGPAILLTYQADSAPDPVTGKVVRDAFEQYTFFKSGRQVTLTLSGPTNADNVDPWRIVSDSLRWA